MVGKSCRVRQVGRGLGGVLRRETIVVRGEGGAGRARAGGLAMVGELLWLETGRAGNRDDGSGEARNRDSGGVEGNVGGATRVVAAAGGGGGWL